jgi:hypothetical protein
MPPGGLNLFDTALVGNVGAVSGFDDTSLKAYWKFNEASGDIINQSQSAVDLGTAADLQVTGATYGVTGKIGDALSFDGVNDYAVAGTSVSQFDFMHENTSTLVFWMKYGSTPGTTEAIFSTNEQGDGAGMFVNTGATTVLGINYTNATPANLVAFNTSTGYIPDTTNWYFYTIKVDASLTTNTGIIRRNDANEETGNRQNAPVDGNSHRAMLLAARQLTSPQRYGDFDIDETSIWNKIMSSDDETSLYNGGSGLEIY